jgi:ribosomal protein S18 acetylase RimI-like enzyme
MIYTFTYRSIAEVLYLSLNQDPFYLELEGSVSDNPTVRQEALLRYFDYSMREGQEYGELWIPEGEVYGASVWSKPMTATLSSQASREKKRFIRQNLGSASLRKYTEMVGFMSERAERVVPAGSWYLSIVGVAPQLQGQGLGSTLVRPVLEKADALGVASYLETFTRKNTGFYQRLGYQEASSFVEPVTGSEYWIMVREPP